MNYVEVGGWPQVALSGDDCIRLAGVKGIPELIAQPIRRAAERHRELLAGDADELSTDQAARLYGVTRRQVVNYCLEGNLRARRLGRRWLIGAGQEVKPQYYWPDNLLR